jgi:hypothetical protein
MSKKWIILIFLLVPIVNLFYSCVCDVTTKYRSYSHKTLLLINLDNSGKQTIETESSQINKNAYGIRLYLTREKNTVACTKQMHSIFVQSAYATSIVCPPEYIYSPTDSILSIKIFTLNNFDNQNSENSEITDYFRVAHSYSTVENYVANMYYTYEDNFEYWWQEMEIDLLLMTAPTANNKQQFEVQITLSDGRILKQQTLEIELI